jgi:hypothetical protein
MGGSAQGTNWDGSMMYPDVSIPPPASVIQQSAAPPGNFEYLLVVNKCIAYFLNYFCPCSAFVL